MSFRNKKIKSIEQFNAVVAPMVEQRFDHPKGFLGKQHTEGTKAKMKAALQGHGSGSKNSQFGTMWITNGSENKKIKLSSDIPQGWSKGRK